MRWQGLALKAISQAVSWGRWSRAPRAGLRVLTYHTVGQHAYGDDLDLNTISLEHFQEHLDVLAAYKVSPLRATGLPSQTIEVAITFDDGYADNLYVAAPMLLKRNMPFTVFVTAKFVRDKTTGFLTERELRELAALPGVTIGAHGDTHCDLTTCDQMELQRELMHSKRYLEGVLGKPVTTMAYPYGAADQRVRSVAHACGYELAACSYFDINRPGRAPLMINRSVVLNGDSAKVLTQKLNGDWDWYRLRMTDPLRRLN